MLDHTTSAAPLIRDWSCLHIGTAKCPFSSQPVFQVSAALNLDGGAKVGLWSAVLYQQHLQLEALRIKAKRLWKEMASNLIATTSNLIAMASSSTWKM